MFRKWIATLLFAIPLACFAQNIDLLILNKNYPEALTQIKRTLAVSPDAELYFKQGMIYRQISMPLYAERSISQAIALDSTNSRYLDEFADLQMELGNPFKAIPYYQKASLFQPEDYDLKFRLGKAFMSTENLEQAYGTFMMLRYKDSTNVVYNRQLGLAAFRLQKFEQAIDLFESVLDVNPNDLSMYQNLITLYATTKDAVNVVRTADRALYFFPENSSILLREANALYSTKEFVEAKPVYEQYLAKNDSIFDVMKNYGLCLYTVKDNVKARQILEKCFEIEQDDPILNFYLGMVCRYLSDLPKSIEYLNYAIEGARIGMTEMYHSLGQVYGLQREFGKSIEALKEAYKCDPQKTEFLVEIANTYDEFNPNKKLALEFYNKYLAEAGDSAINAPYARERIDKIRELSLKNKKSGIAAQR